MDASTWWYLKKEVDRRKRLRIKKSRKGWSCAGCGGKYDRYTADCLICARRRKERKQRRS